MNFGHIEEKLKVISKQPRNRIKADRRKFSMIKRKRREPRIEPCGTHLNTFSGVENFHELRHFVTLYSDERSLKLKTHQQNQRNWAY